MRMKREAMAVLVLPALLVTSVLTALPAAAQGASASATAATSFRQEELEQLAAPIALYPDSLVSQMLMAATYPLEVVQAERFVAQHKNLQGEALARQLDAQPWDPSVKSLANFPQALLMMSSQLEWTQKLGDAFLAQPRELFAAIQRLRAKAQAAGYLKSSPEQTVVVRENVIIIEPASTTTVYVPVYDPVVVYGTWPYTAYPPYYYYPPGYVAAPRYGFGAGIILGLAWGYAWGSADWNRGEIDIDVDRNIHFHKHVHRTNITNLPAKGAWRHDVDHRRGVPYHSASVAQRYRPDGHVAGSRDRQTYRGHAAPEARTGAAAAGRAGPAPERTARASNPDETRFERPGSAASANRMLDRQGVGGAEARAHADRGARSRTAAEMAGPDRGLRRN